MFIFEIYDEYLLGCGEHCTDCN